MERKAPSFPGAAAKTPFLSHVEKNVLTWKLLADTLKTLRRTAHAGVSIKKQSRDIEKRNSHQTKLLGPLIPPTEKPIY